VDHRYDRLVNGQSLDQVQLQDQLRVESGSTVSSALATDENTWKKETKVFAMPREIYAFRGDSGRRL